MGDYKERIHGKVTPKLFRQVISDVHGSVKWVFQVVMALALVQGIRLYTESAFQSSITSISQLQESVLSWDTFVFAFCFVPFFVRMFLGTVRYMDLSYIEMPELYGFEKEISKFNLSKVVLDIVSALTYGILFFLLATVITNHFLFLSVTVVILLLNASFLGYFIIKDFKKIYEPEPLIGNMGRYEPPCKWMVNNLIFGLFILLPLLASIPNASGNQPFFIEALGKKITGIEFGLGLLVLNSLIDIGLTYKLYCPPVRQLFEDSSTGKYEVFVSTPISSLNDDNQRQKFYRELEPVLELIEEKTQKNFYCVGKDVTKKNDFSDPSLAAENDYKAIKRSKCFILVYPSKVASSVIYEAGWATALKVRSVYCIPEGNNPLPFLMQEVASYFVSTRIIRYRNMDHLKKELEKNWDSITAEFISD